jgi:flagellar motor switch protein FliN/FliY
MTDQARGDDAALAAAWEEALGEQGAVGGPEGAVPAGGDLGSPPGGFARAPLDELSAEPGTGIPRSEVSLDAILDIPVSLSMEIGRTRISIRHLLQLNQGSVVELDRLAGEPLDVLVNGTLIAHGEVVVVNEKFGIRLTDVISAHERVQKLR